LFKNQDLFPKTPHTSHLRICYQIENGVLFHSFVLIIDNPFFKFLHQYFPFQGFQGSG